jgi:hypothetical protein
VLDLCLTQLFYFVSAFFLGDLFPSVSPPLFKMVFEQKIIHKKVSDY